MLQCSASVDGQGSAKWSQRVGNSSDDAIAGNILENAHYLRRRQIAI